LGKIKVVGGEMVKMKKHLMLLFLVFSLVLTACNSNTATDKKAGDTAPSSEPKQGGNVSIPIVGDPIFNPWHPNAYAESNIVNRIIFSGLTKPGLDNAPAPSLAKSWDVSEDGLVWTFELRDDVKWHDGEQFTAGDVAFTFNDLVLNESLGANGSSNYKALDKVEVVDDYKVEFHLKRPWAALPSYLAFNSEIMPEHKLSGKDVWNYTEFNKEAPVGTGPFIVDKYISGQEVKLKANPEFFNGAPYLDTVTYKILPDMNTQIAQALSNELDIFVLEDKASLKRVENANNINVVASDITRYFWLVTDVNDPKFEDKRVRQAILHAIDRQAIIDSVLQGYGKIADAAITPDQKQYYSDDVNSYDFDPEKAKQLLKEVGWDDTDGDGILDKDGKPFSFTFDVALQGDLEQIAVLVQQYLKEIGMDVDLNTLEWNAMIQKNIIERDFDMLVNWWSYPSDPDVLAQYHSSNAEKGNNIPGYKNEELDKLLEEGQATGDQEERAKIYKKVQEHMAENLPYIYLWYPQEISIRNKRLHDVPDIYFGGTLHYINEWWVE
jgi:peptide/nickel transport system substrate-binding protein